VCGVSSMWRRHESFSDSIEKSGRRSLMTAIAPSWPGIEREDEHRGIIKHSGP
jgi:hypothetical protein